MALRLCHILSGDTWGGAEAVTLNLLRILNETKEFEVHVIVLNRGRLHELLEEESIRFALLDEKQNNAFQLIFKLRRHLKTNRYDIVHTHGYKANILASGAVKLMTGSKLVRTEHGIAGKAGKNWKMTLLAAIDWVSAVLFNDKIIAVSKQIQREKYPGAGRSKTVVVHNGIDAIHTDPDISLADVKKEWGIDEDAKLVGVIGRLAPIKGVDTFLEIARMVSKEDDSIRFVVIGDGPMRKELEIQAHSLGLDGKVVFAGFRNPVSPCLAALDLMAITSRHEGIPIVLLEAFSLGIPVVAFDVGGIPEVIIDGECGVLVPRGDSKTFAREILALLADPSRYAKMRLGGFQRVSSEFSAGVMAGKTMSVYRSLCSR